MSKTTQEQIEVMQHYIKDGAVEVYSKGTNTWNLISNPDWDWHNSDYRIKEQKKTITIEKWLLEDDDEAIITIEVNNIRLDTWTNLGWKKLKLLETYEVEL